ncbi:MAG: alpha/beta hydrolase, partial [Candidatus Mariimomonas ferrooxydans]
NGLYLDAEAVYEYMKNEKGAPPERIIIYGESLGGAVAVDLASRHETGGIIIEGTFTSVREMAKKIFPFIPTFIYKSRFDSLKKIKAVKTPKLIFHSADDEVVPFELGKALYDAAEEPKEFVEIKGGHNDAFLVSGDIFSNKINEFVKKIEK